jgi:hypothetical protein
MSATLPIKIYEILEAKLGKEDARELVNALEEVTRSLARENKIAIKDELSSELVTKGYFDERISHLETKIDSKLRLYFIVLLFAMFILNPKAIDLIAKLLGIIK